MQAYLEEDVLYLYALSRIKGFGAQTLLRIVKVAPKLSDLPHLSGNDLQEQLGSTLGKVLLRDHYFFRGGTYAKEAKTKKHP